MVEMNLKSLFLILSLTASVFCVSCGKDDHVNGDESSTLPGDEGGKGSTLFIGDVPYTLKVASRDVFFTEDDIAKPLVMNVSGKNVTGTLVLQNVDGTFAGTLKAPVNIADSLELTGTIEIPAAGGDTDDRSTISLDDLKQKCGHKYTANFRYAATSAAELTDSQAYFHFKMSPLQHWLLINSKKYPMSDDGEVWVAIGENTPIVTSFFKMTYQEVHGGETYTIDHSGLVDLGIAGVLWADKNVGATSFVDPGKYYSWDDAQTSVETPLEVPNGGKAQSLDNDFAILCASTAHKWCEYKGVWGACFFMPGHEDIDKDPMIFLPAGGVKQASVFAVNESGMYWTSTRFDSYESFRFFFNQKRFTTESRIKNNWGDMLVRPIVHCNAKNDNKNDNTPVELMELRPFFPEDYSWDDVAAWYTNRNEDENEEWALYLLKNNRYILTQYIAKSDTKIIQNSGDYSVVGEADPNYRNFDIELTVWHRKKNVHFENGGCNFLKVQLNKEQTETPLISKCTKDNSNTSILYYPWVERLDISPVVAWYKQEEAHDDEVDFMAFYLYDDAVYRFVKCWIRNGEQAGSMIFDGYLIGHDDLIGLDLRNMSVDIFRDESGFKNTGSLSVVDGVLTISGYDIKMEMQDPQLLRELLGL